MKRFGIIAVLPVVAWMALSQAVLGAGVALPVKGFTKPDEGIVVKFLAEKPNLGESPLVGAVSPSDRVKKALDELGADAGRLDFLYAVAPNSEFMAADGKSVAFKIFSAKGEEQKLTTDASALNVKDGTIDLAAVCPKLKDGGTFFLVWKDAAPLVIETLYNPGRGPREFEKIKAQVAQLPEDQQKTVKANYAPVVTHTELASYAVITTDKGVIKAKFSYEIAPHTVDNFISLARQGFYDGSNFHRIISGFMIQGGDAYANVEGSAGTGGPGYQIMHEFSDKKHTRGVLSMARSSSPPGRGEEVGPSGTAYVDTSASQFFIMHGDNDTLDGSYSAFGDVLEGMDVVDAIAKTPVSDKNGTVRGAKPKIVSVRILPATAAMYGLSGK